MGTWSSYRAPLENTPDLNFSPVTDGEYLYWLFTSGTVSGIVQYDPDADVETIIYDEGDASGLYSIYDYTIFKDELYLVGSITGTFDFTIFRYTGIPHVLTELETIRVGRTAGTSCNIWANEDSIAAIAVDFNIAHQTAGKHSSDGINWSVSSFETLPISGNGGYSYVLSTKMHKYRPIINAFCVSNSGAPLYNCTSSNLMEFTGDGWENVVVGIADNSEAALLISPIFNQCWTRNADPISGLYTQRTNDSFDDPDIPDNQIQPLVVDGYGKQFGHASGTTASEIYIWRSNNDSDWELYDTVSDEMSLSGVLNAMLVLDNLDAYLIFYNVGNTRIEIWKRDDKLPPINAMLYFGHAVLQEASELSFRRSMPQAMTLRESLGTLVMGSAYPDAEMVEYAEHPYTGPIEADTGMPTGTSISAIRWV